MPPASSIDFRRPEQVEDYAKRLIDAFHDCGGFEALSFTPEQLTLRAYAADWLAGVRLFAASAPAHTLPRLFSWLDWMAIIAGDTTNAAVTLPDRYNPRLLDAVTRPGAPAADPDTAAYLRRWLGRTSLPINAANLRL